MKYYINLIVNYILLITTTTLFANPSNIDTVNTYINCDANNFYKSLLTFDDYLEFIDEMEYGDLDKYTPLQQQQMLHLLLLIARNGLLQNQKNEKILLEDDIQELLSNFNPYEMINDEFQTSINFYDQQMGIGKWAAKKWKHIRHFCRDHKKGLLIGSAVIVAVVGVAYLAAAAEATEAASALGAAGASKLGDQSDSKTKKDQSGKNSNHQNTKQNTSIKDEISSEIASNLEEIRNINDEILLCDANDENSFLRLQERLRVAASKVTHDTLNNISDLAIVVPGLMDELSNIKNEFLPESLTALIPSHPEQDNENFNSYLEKYEDNVSNLHDVIDNIFSTDLANNYTPESKAFQNENLTRAILPPPGAFISGDKFLPKTLVNNNWGWKVGQEINNRTRFGQVPKWNTVRKRHWKNQAFKIKSDPNFRPQYATKPNVKRMDKGLAPQQLNHNTGKLESMELHHIPPQREGGLFDFIEVWPDEHAAIDKYRHTGK